MKHQWHKHPHVRSGDELTLGERSADRVRNILGSWAFIWVQTVLIATWMVLNLVAWSTHWDPFPWVLLNLVFSTQAAYASPIILLSQRRGDQKASELAVSTYENAVTILEEIRSLASKTDLAAARDSQHGDETTTSIIEGAS